ncbi:sugar ABC transporter permease [Phocoenobacter atlanticus subsp. cyclopteri]|uniref:carbohydrate ABC transporter permease n=1 Tax=Phocoenobacter atlanticus TaxID=3416742 RepID=UPI001BC9A4CD|nr:sugar ABC transporter permease [Pasteurella atlantica]QVE21794.1 sugar ABC transporter permease [Pasteurella atlantica]
MIKIFNNKKFGKQLFIFSFLLPTLLCFFIFYFYSVATIFVTSFTKWDYTNLSHPEFLGFDNLFANYHYIFKEYPFFMEALFNSIRWAIIGIVIQVPIAVSIAIILSKKLSGWKVTRNLFIIPSIISSAAMGLIFYKFIIQIMV